MARIGGYSFLLAMVLLPGCGENKPAPAAIEVPLKGIELRVSLTAHSPLAEALRNGLNEWEARTGATVKLVESPSADETADVCVVSGTALARTESAIPFSRELLGRSDLRYMDFPPVYRLRFDVRGGETVALPVGTDQLLLWYRKDLFGDPTLAEEYKRATAGRLAPPKTWSEYLQLARFFGNRGGVKYGCVEAMDMSADAVQAYLAHCAAYAKGPNWSSFVFDTETGAPRLTEPPFVRGLNEWIEARKCAPAATGAVVDALTARRTFRRGEAAMLLSAIPPTIDPGVREPSPVADKMAPVPLPGARMVYQPRTGKAEDLNEPNQCIHFGTTGWFIRLGHSTNPAAAEKLVGFLASNEEGYFWVQACRRGYVPVRSSLLTQAGRFAGYGLPVGTTSQFFGVVAANLAAENWVADLRVAPSDELERTLAMRLQSALKGETSPQAALQAAQVDWQKILAPQQSDFLKRYRESLGLPSQ